MWLRVCARLPGSPLSFRQRPMQTKVLRDHGAIGLVADHDKALFGAQDVQAFGAIGHDAKFLARLHEGIPEGLPLRGRDRDLIGQLAREGDPVSAR